MLFSKISLAAVTGLAFFDGALAQNKFPLTGAQSGIVNGLRPPRKELRELFNDKTQLYANKSSDLTRTANENIAPFSCKL